MRLPEWLKVKNTGGLHNIKRILRSHRLSTVCEEARCPNIAACFSRPAAAFMILGTNCTRDCGFCNVKSSTPGAIDTNEPERIAIAAKKMGLRYIVVTSVTRDDLPDGGAGQFARTIASIRQYIPSARIEILTPDFKGNINNLKTVLQAKPDVYNHNIETVPRMYPVIRRHADYRRSLTMLECSKKIDKEIYTKSGIMLGLGETLSEVIDVMKDLRNAGCDFITIGQYLKPSKSNVPVTEYIRPEIFESLRIMALSMGFKYAASAPLVRSSMLAEEMFYSKYNA